ncbi:hypothetical protein SO694_000422112 [Aureococcus anophagefferens]|uniref:Major facilitator superfamily (MFS) profile domain-containing protein n=1 Tax=Aureococcus anophagefferens TaxID=44056 RepID=A0ABR1G7G4_AURAN
MCRPPALEEEQAALQARATRTKRAAAAMTFVSMAAMASTMPYTQSKRDAVGCDALCVGAMTSARESGDAGAAGAQGALGMAAGVGFLGVAAGGALATPARSAAVALFAFFFAARRVAFAAQRRAPATAKAKAAPGGFFAAVAELARLPSARSPGGLVVLSLRLVMGLSFHVFMAVWQTSLKARFPDFGPSDHAKFMGFIGLGYAASQGLVSKPAIKFAETRGGGEKNLLVACCACLSLGRVAAVASTSLPLVYAAYAPVIVALGVVNAAITGAVSRVAPPDERGTFFGVVSAIESCTGIVGPMVGGVVSLKGTGAVCAVVCALYAAAAAVIHRHWHRLATDPAKKAS